MIKNLNLNRWKIFLVSFIGVFAVTGVYFVGIKPTAQKIVAAKTYIRSISPLPQEDQLINKLREKLELKINKFKVQSSTGLIPKSYAAADFDQLNSYVVVDFDTGEVILEKSLSKKVSIASITKVMSAVVALDLASLGEEFEVSEHAAGIEPTKIGVVSGQRMNVSELVHAALLTSANDAVEVLKEGVDKKYGNGAFIKAMNLKAKFLGMKNSSFANVQGFDNRDHYSSSEDLAILTAYALSNYPEITEIVAKDYEFLPESNRHKQFDLYNWNGLLGVYPGVRGIKIGNTQEAGMTTSIIAEREGKRLLAIILGAPGVLERDLWAAQLLDAGFEKRYGMKPVDITEKELKKKYSTWKYWN